MGGGAERYKGGFWGRRGRGGGEGRVGGGREEVGV